MRLDPIDILCLVLIALSIVGGFVALEIADRRARRRGAAAWHAYFHGGGLVRQLLSRWKGPPRLTDRRDHS
jgi:hypothetical protein